MMRTWVFGLFLAWIGAACGGGAKSTPAPESGGAVAGGASGAPEPGADDEALRERCCAQCQSAGARDPSDQGLQDAQCSSFRGEIGGEPGLDAECAAYFDRAPATFGECSRGTPPQAPAPPPY